MNRRAAVVLFLVFGGFFAMFLVFLGLAWAALQKDTPVNTLGGGGPKIGVVELTGTIGDPQGGIEGKREAGWVRRFAEDDDIAGILVRIDSPGGAVAPSQEIAQAIQQARTKKKVVCSQGNVAASGGYWISVACDEIVANPGTLTGSIGVISQFWDASEWITTAKLEQRTIKTGALKDSGSPFRDMTPEDLAYFEALQQDIFQQFLEAVAEGRKKTIDEIRPVADGRVMTGREAKRVGLVDTLGNFQTAVQRLKELASIEGDPDLVYPDHGDEFDFLRALRGEARVVAREAAAGVMEGATGGLARTLGLRGGVLAINPMLVPAGSVGAAR